MWVPLSPPLVATLTDNRNVPPAHTASDIYLQTDWKRATFNRSPVKPTKSDKNIQSHPSLDVVVYVHYTVKRHQKGLGLGFEEKWADFKLPWKMRFVSHTGQILMNVQLLFGVLKSFLCPLMVSFLLKAYWDLSFV